MGAEPFAHPFHVERQVHGYAVVVRVTSDAMTVREAAGLNEVYRGHLAALEAGVWLRVVARHRHVLRPFEVSGLDQEIRPCRTVAEALVVRTSRGVRRFALPST